ncbi:hypothetical protein AVEN_21355-1 [Araneus ventricosus]|uniref:Uncharacterized protein n=1 Tax=Araneus ventricosus TaxID=182803 RepID=A0A4Y2QW61_ARAVE|nr:hypothetical protein AVEN_21355-1 [Araneus ventricosus]
MEHHERDMSTSLRQIATLWSLQFKFSVVSINNNIRFKIIQIQIHPATNADRWLLLHIIVKHSSEHRDLAARKNAPPTGRFSVPIYVDRLSSFRKYLFTVELFERNVLTILNTYSGSCSSDSLLVENHLKLEC